MLGIDHIGICARDPKVLADWYINNFGFTLHSVGNAGNYFVESPDKILLEIMVPMKDHESLLSAGSTSRWCPKTLTKPSRKPPRWA